VIPAPGYIGTADELAGGITVADSSGGMAIIEEGGWA